MLLKNGNVENIKSRLSITDVVSSYVKLEKAGVNYKARCPFHNEKTPSFIVSPGRGSFYCFGCGAKGDIFTFVERFEGVDFLGALKILADRAGIILEREDVHSKERKDEKEKLFSVLEQAGVLFEKNLSQNPSVGEYLKSRGISEKTISLFRIGYTLPKWRDISDELLSQKFSLESIENSGLAKRVQDGSSKLYDRFRGRVMFPLFDASGRGIGFSGRLFPPDEAEGKEMVGEAKYVNSPETALFHKSKFLYGLHFAKEGIRKMGFSMLVEGQIDLLHCHQAGYRNTVALSGTALSEDQVSLLKRFSEKLLLALDSDTPGRASAHKSAEVALSKGMDVKILSLTLGKDPADMLLQDAESFKECIRNAKHPVEFFLESVISLIPDERKRKKEGLHLVLPLLFAIQSPSDRAHFEGIVSKRLAISEEALKEEIYLYQHEHEKEKRGNMSSPEVSLGDANDKQLTLRDRILQNASGILLLSKGKTYQGFDAKGFEEEFRKLIGEKGIQLLEEDPLQEEMAFRIEERCATVSLLQKEAQEILLRLKREILQESLGELSEKIRQHEARNEDTTELTRVYNTHLQEKRSAEKLLEGEEGTL